MKVNMSYAHRKSTTVLLRVRALDRDGARRYRHTVPPIGNRPVSPYSPGNRRRNVSVPRYDEEYPREKTTESFLTALEEGPAHNCFAGAYLPGLDLAGETVTTPDERPLDLRGAIIDGVLNLTDARITVPVILDGATIIREIKAENAAFEGPVSLVDTALQKGLHWQGATI